MQSGIKTTRRAGREDMASYLDRLLRQEPEQALPAPSNADPEYPASFPAMGQQGGLPSWDRASAPGAADRSARPGVEESAASSRAGEDRRPAQAARRQVRTRSHYQSDRLNRVMQTGMAVLVPILAITFVLVVRNAFKPASPRTVKAVAILPSVAKPANDIEVDWEIPPVYQADGRDPMKIASSSVQDMEGVVTQADVRKKLDVKGVVLTGSRLAVIIGANLVREGDPVPDIQGLTVIRIGDDGVEFGLNGKSWKQDARQDLEVKGILVSEDKPAAIIGTRLVHKGDELTEIPGLTVIGIELDGVEFELGSERWKQTVSSPAEAPH